MHIIPFEINISVKENRGSFEKTSAKSLQAINEWFQNNVSAKELLQPMTSARHFFTFSEWAEANAKRGLGYNNKTAHVQHQQAADNVRVNL